MTCLVPTGLRQRQANCLGPLPHTGRLLAFSVPQVGTSNDRSQSAHNGVLTEKGSSGCLWASLPLDAMITITTPSGDGGSPTKRMRLGTKSCSECRRRKVRCIFLPEQCRLQGLHYSQLSLRAPAAQGEHHRSAANHSENSEAQLLKQRLAALEDIVRGLPGSSQQPPASVPSDIWSTPENPSDDAVESFQSAPLISLFRNASLLQGSEPSPSSGAATKPISQLDDQVLDVLRRLQLLIPTRESLALVAEATEMLWPTWPQYYYGPTRSDTIQAGQLQRTNETLSQALSSGRPGVIAKTVSWLSLCLQQLPAEKAMQQYGLPDEPRRLVEAIHGTCQKAAGGR